MPATTEERLTNNEDHLASINGDLRNLTIESAKTNVLVTELKGDVKEIRKGQQIHTQAQMEWHNRLRLGIYTLIGTLGISVLTAVVTAVVK